MIQIKTIWSEYYLKYRQGSLLIDKYLSLFFFWKYKDKKELSWDPLRIDTEPGQVSWKAVTHEKVPTENRHQLGVIVLETTCIKLKKKVNIMGKP